MNRRRIDRSGDVWVGAFCVCACMSNWWDRQCGELWGSDREKEEAGLLIKISSYPTYRLRDRRARFMESEKRGGRAQNRGWESCGEREKRWGRRGVGWESFREEERMNSREEFWQKRWQRGNRGGWNMETRWNFPIANLSVVKMSHSLNLDKDH